MAVGNTTETMPDDAGVRYIVLRVEVLSAKCMFGLVWHAFMKTAYLRPS